MIPGHLGPDVDVVYGGPSPLPEALCTRCDNVDAHAVADVTWPVTSSSRSEELTDGAIVCRVCLPDQVTTARDTLIDGGIIAVDVPVWTDLDVTRLTGIIPATLTDWAWGGFVNPDLTPQGRRWFADEVAHVQQLARLVRGGMHLEEADGMIRRRPELAAQVLAFFAETRTARAAA